MMQSTGRKNSWAVWPTTLSTAGVVLGPRQLDHDVVALDSDVRVGDAEAVDPVVDYLLGLLEVRCGDVALWLFDHRHATLQVQAEQRRLAGDDGGPDAKYSDGDYEDEAPNERPRAHRQRSSPEGSTPPSPLACASPALPSPDASR